MVPFVTPLEVRRSASVISRTKSVCAGLSPGPARTSTLHLLRRLFWRMCHLQCLWVCCKASFVIRNRKQLCFKPHSITGSGRSASGEPRLEGRTEKPAPAAREFAAIAYPGSYLPLAYTTDWEELDAPRLVNVIGLCYSNSVNEPRFPTLLLLLPVEHLRRVYTLVSDLLNNRSRRRTRC